MLIIQSRRSVLAYCTVVRRGGRAYHAVQVPGSVLAKMVRLADTIASEEGTIQSNSTASGERILWSFITASGERTVQALHSRLAEHEPGQERIISAKDI